MISVLGDDASTFTSIFSAVASTGSKIGASWIASDAQVAVAQDQADAQTRLGISQDALALALGRLSAANQARTNESLSFGLSAAALLALLILGLGVL